MRLGEILVRAGLVSESTLAMALHEARRMGCRLGQVLIDRGIIPEHRLFDALAEATSLPRLDIRTVRLHERAVRMVTREWATQHGAIPIEVEEDAKTLTVAVTDPTHEEPFNDLSFRTDMKIRLVLGSDSEVERLIRYAYFGEALDRSTSTRAPGRPTQAQVEIDDSMIIRGMDGLRNEIQDTGSLTFGSPIPDAEKAPRPAASDPGADAETARILSAQRESARALRALFELCVERGLITREEYRARLDRLSSE